MYIIKYATIYKEVLLMNNIRKQEIKTAKVYDKYVRLTNSEGAIETNKDMRDIRKSLKGVYNMAVMFNGCELTYFDFLKNEQAYWKHAIESYLEYQKSQIRQSHEGLMKEALDAFQEGFESVLDR